MSTLDWYPHPTGDTTVDFALRTAFENLYTLRNQMNAAHATIPPPAPSFADISNALKGSAPNALNVTGLPGTLSQPQPSKIVQSNTFPPSSSAVDGQLAWVNGVAYRYNATTKMWVPLNGFFLYGTRGARQDHVAHPQFNPLNLALGTPYYESDSGLIYIVQPDINVAGTPNQWFYLTGIGYLLWQNRNAPGAQWSGNLNWNYTDANASGIGGGVYLITSDSGPGQSANGTLQYVVQYTSGSGAPATWVYSAYFENGIYQNMAASSPGPPLGGSSPLVATDAGYVMFAGNVGHSWRWTGPPGWTFANGGEGAGGTEDGPVLPNPGAGWWQQVPVAGGVINVSASNGGTTPITYPAYTSFNSLNPGWFKWARL